VITAVQAGGAGSTKGDVPQPRLVKAAHDFEAQLMKELLKPMTGQNSCIADADDSGAGGILGEFAAEALGRSLSEHGGFGIAERIVQGISEAGKESPAQSQSGTILTIPYLKTGND
jgi:Rod binding domain-containing protein